MGISLEILPRQALILYSQLQLPWPARQCLTQRCQGQFGAVVLFADMRDRHMLEALPVQHLEKARRLLVAQVTQIATDPSPQTRRIRPFGKHFRVVIGFQKQGIQSGIPLNDPGRYQSRVGKDTKAAIPTLEDKLTGLAGIVRHGYRQYPNVANIEVTIQFQTLYRQFEGPQSMLSTGSHIHRQLIAPSEALNSLYMISMLMGDQDGGQLPRA